MDSKSEKKNILQGLSLRIKLLVITAVVLAVGYGSVMVAAMADVGSSIQEVQKEVSNPINPLPEPEKVNTEATSEAKSDDKKIETPEPAKSVVEAPNYPAKSVTKPADEPAKSVEQKPGVVKVEGGHIPFTYGNGVPGQPETYVDTVGECPFYEMAGAKGCVPPPNLECNEDWSVCTLKED